MTKPSLRIVFMADTHLGFDDAPNPTVQRRRRGPDFFANYQRVLDYAAQTQPDLVVHGGDFFFRSRVHKKIVDIAYGALYELAEAGIPIFIVPGNHERSKMPPSLWLAHPRIHVFDRPRTYRLSVRDTTVALSGFPFIRGHTREKFQETLAATHWNAEPADVNLMCMHEAVEGAQVGPNDFTFRPGDGVISMIDLPPQFQIILAGHIHRRQILPGVIEGNSPRVVYPGSTERTSFAERSETKGFCEIDIAPTAAGDWHVENVRFLDLPARAMIEIDIAPVTNAATLQSFLQNQTSRIDQNAIVRVISSTELAPTVGSMLTASFLRSVCPPTMNVQLSPALYGHVTPVVNAAIARPIA